MVNSVVLPITSLISWLCVLLANILDRVGSVSWWCIHLVIASLRFLHISASIWMIAIDPSIDDLLWGELYQYMRSVRCPFSCHSNGKRNMVTFVFLLGITQLLRCISVRGFRWKPELIRSFWRQIVWCAPHCIGVEGNIYTNSLVNAGFNDLYQTVVWCRK